MSLTSILPWKRGNDSLPGKKLPIQRDSDIVDTSEYPQASSFLSLNNQINRLFDDFWRNPFSMRPFDVLDRMLPATWGSFNPSVDISESDKEIKLEAELPGMDENNIEISISNDVLTIKGEKQEESERKDRNFYFTERSYGSFIRQFALPGGVDEDKIEATFKKGVLTVSMPKRPEVVEQRKRISIKKA
ncbi:MAG: Hsp20/alpha crystallin family protein [Anaerolineae bacterium]|nr:Hsp20/alpha crystallin family protein [Anaerolineae bacterium]